MRGKLDYVEGQLRSLVGVVSILIAAHPTPDAVRQKFDKANNDPPDSPEDLSVSDSYLTGLNEMNRRMAALMDQAVVSRGGNSTTSALRTEPWKQD